MLGDDLVEREPMLNRFRRLIGELARGSVSRTIFQPWEVEILLDVENTLKDPKQRIGVLRAYERAVIRQLETETETEPGPPMKLSEYVHTRRTRRPAKE